ncbi:hypothetical protein K501DRAFT_295948 [Backusella circina FSU 941]|nr:hypothetical protein K501DRAFT_299344 [Backusella circina FSU 941]KAI8881218.1 hypothetical protein K501DRAFT_295948 [Backusella circina FSU 941]
MLFCCTIGIDRFQYRSGNGCWHCPNCYGHSVYYVKAKPCFMFCFIPLIPCGNSQRLYECHICGWVNIYQPPY